MDDLPVRIGGALDALIERGRHAEFEDLAHHLLRNKFSSLTLSERSHDGGEDAYPLFTAPGEPRVRMAASFDASRSKVLHDAERIHGRTREVDQLVFVTPRKVNRIKTDRWKEEIQRRFGWTLEVMSRAGLIAELERPENAWLCRKYLRLEIDDVPDADAAAEKARAALARLLPELHREHHTPSDLIDLTFVEVKDGRRSGEDRLGIGDLAEQARGGARILLRGPAGAGKTCTFLQLAALLAADAQGTVPVYVSAADWALGSRDLQSFAADELDLTGDELAALHEAGRLVFLLNGWNEVATEAMAAAAMRVRELARRWPNASLVASAREGDEGAPPFAPTLTLAVAELDDPQREAIVRAAGIEDSGEFLLSVGVQPELDAITRTPLFLATALAAVRQGGALPASRYALLSATVRDAEAGEHHRPLQEVCGGQHRRYLETVAERMTRRGTTRLTRDECLSTIADCSRELIQAALIRGVPNAVDVLRVLSDHHLLVVSVSDTATVGFHHPLFQEWFGAEWLHRWITRAVGGTGSEIEMLRREVLNRPAWGESLHLLMERCREREEPLVAAAVVRWMVPLDLVFAARLVGAAGDRAWSEVHSTFEQAIGRLEEDSASQAREFVLAIVTASGRPEFSGMLWPMLQHEDDQVRAEAYDLLAGANLEVLGRDWPSRLRATDEGLRAEFSEWVGTRGSAAALAIARALEGEASPLVRSAVVQALEWHGMDQLAVRWVEESPPHLITEAHFAEMLRWIPRHVRIRIAPWLRTYLPTVQEPDLRRPILRNLALAGDRDALVTLQGELVENPEVFTDELLRTMVALDPEWTRGWAVDRITAGELPRIEPESLLEGATKADAGAIAAAVLAREDEGGWDMRLLAACARIAPAEVAARLAREWLDAVRKQASQAGVEVPRSSRRHDIDYMLRRLDLSARVSGFLSLSEPPANPQEMKERLHFIGSEIPREDFDAVEHSARERLRAAILDWHTLLQGWPERRRHLQPTLALVLSSVGTPADVEVVFAWLSLDYQEYLDHVHREGHRRNIVGYANLYVRAIARFRSERAGDLLLQLLADPEYFSNAAQGLAALLRTPRPFDHDGRRRRAEALERRRAGGPRSPLAARYGEAIATALSGYLRRRDPDKPIPPFDHHLGEAARALGELDHVEAVPSILEIATFRWCDFYAVDALLELVYNGRVLSTAELLPVLEPLLERRLEPQWVNDQEWWPIRNCVTLLLFCDDPAPGLAYCRRLVERFGASHEVRDLIERMGDIESPAVALALADLLRTPGLHSGWQPEIISALGRHASMEGATILLDHLASMEVAENRRGYDTRSALVESFTAAAQRHPEVRRDLLARAEGSTLEVERSVLISIFRKLDDDAVRLAACFLLDDDDREVPYELREVFKDAFYRKEPVGGGSAYTLVPKSCNPVREALFALMGDSGRRRSARSILLFVEVGRAKDGRPMDEPRHPAVDQLGDGSTNWLLSA